ncbi:hypothetical protein [Lentzea sp. NPDC003310]|uniref:hypothetical protein n=1 Tax=Lentzea sp. NPDC003310 TaxID=3154447 RepID=UPI0033A28BD8
MSPAAVLVSGQTAMSIKVTVAPPARDEGRTTISNELVGGVHGTVRTMNSPEGR